ncbi:MAG TPA: ATP-binding cassette domain-containing protein, partial [Ktedonobacterales bacterium]|nr:ATP-binding cassette domain-containing protein [Ktedonobacterales bacterium]
MTERGDAISADGLTKRYGAFCAVEDVSLRVGHGEIYAFLGLNGAGKTTTIRML